MKLSCVLVACNEKPLYLQFWPIVKKTWWEFVQVPCIMVYVGSEIPEELKNDPAVIHWKPIPSWPTATQAQCIRLLYPALLKCDGAVILSDMDMIPLQKDFFVKDGFEKFSESQFVSLRGIDEARKEIYMCYVGATPSVWSELFEIKTIEDTYKIMNLWATTSPSDGVHGSLGWCTDQLVLYNKVKEWQSKNPEKIGLLPWTQSISRLDRGNPYEWLIWNPMLEKNLKRNIYVDFHMPPYNQCKQQIDIVLEYCLIQNMKSASFPRVLMLILSSDTNEYYRQFQSLWRQYINSNPNIDCYFYKADPNLEEEALLVDKNTLVVKCEESLDKCYEKTLKAFEYFSPQFNKYDYIFRTNLSSFVVFDHYLEFCKILPKSSMCSALIGTTSYGLQFPSGAGFTLTPDLATRLLEEKPPLIEQDDVSIGQALKVWNIPIVPAPRTDILTNEDIIHSIQSNDKSIFHYRVKQLSGNRDYDIFILNGLLSKYYSN